METNDNQAVIDLVKELGEPTEVCLEDKLLVIPESKQVVDLKPFIDKRRDEPERRKGIAQFTDLGSFIEHAVRFRDEHSAIFAFDNPTAPELISVLNYHRAGAEAPRFGDHRGVYAFPLSAEWQAWCGAAGRPMSQGDFAAFLEDRLPDVLDPAAAGESTKAFAAELGISLASPSRLLELSRGLSVRVDAKVTGAVNLSTGEVQLGYEEQHASRDGGPLKVPGGFVIAVPVFRAGDLYQIPVRLTYRIQRSEQRVIWTLKPHRTDRVFDVAFRGAAERARAQADMPLFYGTPES